MDSDDTQMSLFLDPNEVDRAGPEEDLVYLIEEIAQLGVAVDRIPAGPAPEGTRTSGGFELGALLIAVGGSGATVPMLVGLLRDWLSRRGSGSLRLKVGADEIEMTGVATDLQRQALEDFLGRHGA
jgi:hypothetical protein